MLGLAGLAIPVLLHLTQREKKQVVQFPSLMFLRRIPVPVGAAAADPQLAAAGDAAGGAGADRRWRSRGRSCAAPDAAGGDRQGAREVVVLLDRSYSMGYGDRWAAGAAAARDAIAQADAGRPRRRSCCSRSGADVALRSTAERERLDAPRVDAAKPGAGATRYGPALKLAGSILAESPLPRREVVLISDFQRSGWQGAEGARLPDGAVLTPVPIRRDADRPNLTRDAGVAAALDVLRTRSA